MKKFILTICLCILTLICTSCNLVNNSNCNNGHDFEKATFESPKTCKVCGETEGEKLTNDFDQLKKALKDVTKLNYTCDDVPFILLMITDSKIQLCKIERDGNAAMLTATVDGKTGYVYMLLEDDRLIVSSKTEDDEEWNTEIFIKEDSSILSFEIFLTLMEVPVFVPNQDVFTLKDDLWIGDTNLITEIYKDVFKFYLEFDECTEITRYDIKLNNYGEVDTLYFEFVDGNITIPGEYKFSKIGTTKITNAPEIEEAE